MAVEAITSTTDWFTIALVCGVCVLFYTTYTLADKVKRMKEFNPLTEVFAEAKKKHLPVAILEDKSGLKIPFVSEPNPKNKGLINSETTIINPNLVKPSARSHFAGSPDIIQYPMPSYFPYSIHTSAALCQLAEKIRENDLLNWIPSERNVITLLFDGNGDILEDCKMVVSDAAKFKATIPSFFTENEMFDEESYFEDLNEEQIEFISKQLMGVIIDFRREIDLIPVKCEPTYLSEAAELCSVGMVGNDVNSLLTLQEQADRLGAVDWFEKNYTKVLLVVGIAVLPLLYYITITMMK